MKTVVFTKPHNYGGWGYKKDDKLVCPSDRANALVKLGVAKIERAKKGD